MRLNKTSFSPHQAKAEQLMYNYKTFSIDLPNSVHISSITSRVEDVSASILMGYHPGILGVSSKFSCCSLMALSGISRALSVSIQLYCLPAKALTFSEYLSRIVRSCTLHTGKNEMSWLAGWLVDT
ncbi:hypothetical protein RRG08_008004 [Elysia crispata]|uniref:Uncharacterized protein n=1 Tax=Elysia crispata TaxID=231223 RepID=A0AAE0YRQ6_9GAST|nr:hypothetical protein RRG08_008004 [Elysia crispata]